MSTFSVTFNDKKLVYNISGEGQAIVLLHGYLETKELWSELTAVLSKKYQVICPDLPGQGDSEPLNTQTMESMAESVKCLLDHLKIDKVYLFGHSMGGYISLAFAEMFPEKLIKFGLLHSHPFADSDEKKEQRLQEIELVKKGKREIIIRFAVPNYYAPGFATNNKENVDLAINQALKTTDDGMIACISAMRVRKDRLHILKNSSLPALWIAGRKDELFPCERAIETARDLKNTSFHILEKSGHVGMIEEKNETIKILNQFLLA